MTVSNPQKALDEPIAEVVFSTNEMLIAQCYKEPISEKVPKQSILQGSAVKISSYDNSYQAFGLITKINNSSLDNIHKPSALGLNYKELTELQPQVYELLRKELEIYLFAHKEKDGLIAYFPPQKPMMIHDFVHKALSEEVLLLTEDFSNIINFVKKNQLRVELLIHLINEGYKLRNCNDEYLLDIGRNLTITFSDEVQPLMEILKRLSMLKNSKK